MMPGSTERLTGFENHRGGTVLGPEAQPLAQVISGAGNRAGDGIDGAVQGSVVATYLHGPCLARNPELADHLLSRVVGELPPLESTRSTQLRKERLAAPRRVYLHVQRNTSKLCNSLISMKSVGAPGQPDRRILRRSSAITRTTIAERLEHAQSRDVLHDWRRSLRWYRRRIRPRP